MVKSKGEYEPRTYEDELLYSYWQKVGGIVYLEVSIGTRVGSGRWPKGSKVRRIDAVRIPLGKSEKGKVLAPGDYKLKQVQTEFRGKDVEVIEIKRRLNRLVFGQAIAGAEMFQRQYRPRSILPVILYEVPDPAMDWVCRKYGVKTVAPLGKTDIYDTGEEDLEESISEALEERLVGQGVVTWETLAKLEQRIERLEKRGKATS